MLISVNKPPGMTSHDVVSAVRKMTGEKRVGHGGTLDPFASGVLVVGISRESTKKLGEVLKGTEKEYVADLELGKTSVTGDPEGKIIESAEKANISAITEKQIKSVLDTFKGEITQTPPSYSAIKIDGVPAYKRARRGEKIDLPKRKVTIKEIELVGISLPHIKIRVVVSSGTYIRSLAEDIGKALGVGAYLTGLIRTRVGKFTIEESIPFDKLDSKLEALYK